METDSVKHELSAVIDIEDSNYFTQLDYISLKIYMEGTMKGWEGLGLLCPLSRVGLAESKIGLMYA